MAGITFFNEEIEFNLKGKQALKDWISLVIGSEGKKKGDISFIFCDDAYLSEINVQYLKHHTLTDIITFDQKACSSPQVLFLERNAGHSAAEFLEDLRDAFEAENRLHARQTIHPALTSAICQARASWLLDDAANRALFPPGPDWTLLLGRGSDIPKPTQGRTLTVLEVDDLLDPISKLDGNVQALGLGMKDRKKEEKLASEAARRGVDRIVKLGRMHVFAPPWDGVDLIRPMVRMVRQVYSTE